MKDCTRCGKQFMPIPKHREICDDCKAKELVCPDCGGSKTKYGKWCYPCSLKHRDTSKCADNIKKAIEAARSPEARANRSKALMGHEVSEETKRKISEANSGRKHTDEAKRKMSKARKGKPKPENFRKLMSKRLKGSGNPQWKGGVSGGSRYASGWAGRLKDEIRERDNRTCRMCRKVWKPGQNEFDVHHIDGSTTNHNPANLMTVCKSCHCKHHKLEDNFNAGDAK